MIPDLLTIGHLIKDLTPDGYTLGGAVTYSAVTATRLGLRPAIVTSAGPDVSLHSALPGVAIAVVDAKVTTSMANHYQDGKRTQRIECVAEPLRASRIPNEWLSTPLVMLGPLVGEIAPDIAKSFPNSFVVAALQGWLRRWGDDGMVSPSFWDGENVLPSVDVAVVSIDDLGDPSWIDSWKDMVPVLIVTRGKDGADVHIDGQWHHVDTFPTTEVDPTGAGDVFTTAYMIRFGETGDVLESVRFGNCVASFCVEGVGISTIPNRESVEQRLNGLV